MLNSIVETPTFSARAARETWLLTIYAKNERETISASELKKIRDVINSK